MTYKMIVSDLDGTLLNDKKEISPLTIEVVKKLSNKIPFVIATARAPRDVKGILNALDITGPTICYNGALVYNTNPSDYIHYEVIPPPISEVFFQRIYAKKIATSYWLEKNDQYWISDIHNEDIKRWMQDGLSPVGIGNCEKFIKEPFSKVIFNGDHMQIIELIKKEFSDQLTYVYSDSTKKWLEVLRRGVSKGEAVRMISKNMGIDLSQVVAFGDSENDIEMLRIVGKGIAMENSSEELKTVIKERASSNQNDGVANKLIELFEL
ncbi:Cof-type HAD-IIB family hydrolase [Paenibacillus polymyxa]|uniref:Cof-type HAD-IIB family hydrolase n=1 Tax=Paenibacillus polymyxa TaxID=1406 RepID=UPI00307EBAA9